MRSQGLRRPLLDTSESPLPFLSLNGEAEPQSPSPAQSSSKFYGFFSKAVSSSPWLLLAALLLSTAGERVVFKAMVDVVPKHSLTLAILFLLLSFMMYGGLLFHKVKFTNDIIDEVTHFSKVKLFWFSVLDAAQFLLIFGAGHFVPGPLTVLLPQAYIPFMALGSSVAFGTRYFATHIGGVVMLLVSIVAAVLPFVIKISSVHHTHHQSLGSLAYGLAVVPAVISAMLKERTLRDKMMDPVYLHTWVVGFQLLLVIILGPLVLMLQGHTDGISVSDTARSLGNGLKCLFVGQNKESGSCHCEEGAMFLVLYFVLLHASSFILPYCMTKASVLNCLRTVTAGTLLAFLALEVYRAPCLGKHGVESASWPRFGVTDCVALAAFAVGSALYFAKPEPGGEYITVNDDFPEDFVYRVPIRPEPTESMFFGR